ncbi:MAG TPA: sigma-70 family RNA polymerase sigma factor [Polyangiales bacterium]|nr:sigma-70 family RNA polymerase sigma factor [Polyangiales bacterium]
MDEIGDAELLAYIAGGGADGRAAEAALCRRYAPRVRLYGLKHLRDDERTRDLLQIVLLGVLEAARARRIDDPQRLDRFVLGTCRNTALRLRQQRERTPLASDEAVAQLAAAPAARVELVPLFQCLRGLEERAQHVLLQSFVEEHSADEIAAALEISAGNVRVIRHRALAALRKCLDGGGPRP